MARLIWTERAFADLDDITEYIAFDNPEAATRLAIRIFDHVGELSRHPMSGPTPPEFDMGSYRQLSEKPCRVIYRYDGENVVILRVLRSEQLLRPSDLEDPD